MATILDNNSETVHAPKVYLTFDDVLIQPEYSDIPSRENIDTSLSFLGLNLQIPIISSNMDYVTGPDMAIAMYRAGGLGILHRFSPWNDQREAMRTVWRAPAHVAFSVGVRDADEAYQRALQAAFDFGEVIICVDVAHGHHERVFNTVRKLKTIEGVKVIAGNIATAKGYDYLVSAGADAIKVGIGPGSVCTTREVTGVGVPQLSAILDIAKRRSEVGGVPIIADGGIKTSGDIVKALAAGADIVMLGNLLAGSSECPGEPLQSPTGVRYRPYRGQSIFGVNGLRFTPEGISGYVEEKGPVADILKHLKAGLRSGMSYVGAWNLEELKEAIFVVVTANTATESATRVKTTIGDI